MRTKLVLLTLAGVTVLMAGLVPAAASTREPTCVSVSMRQVNDGFNETVPNGSLHLQDRKVCIL